MTEIKRADNYSESERTELAKPHAIKFVNELLFPAYEVLQSDKDISFGDVLEPLFQHFNTTEGDGLLERIDVWNAVQSEIKITLVERRRERPFAQQDVYDLGPTMLLGMQGDIETWLDEYARAERGDRTQTFSESSQLSKLFKQASSIGYKIEETRASMRHNREKGKLELSKRRARRYDWMAKNDIQYTQGVVGCIKAKQESKGGDND